MQKSLMGFPRSDLFILAILVFVAGGILLAGMTAGPPLKGLAADKVPVKLEENPAPVNLAELKNGFALVIGPALPAVVNISSTKIVKQQNNLSNLFPNDPFFRQFFGDQFGSQSPTPRTEREHSLGSGVIVNPDGYILTNNHVISGASDVEVFTQTIKSLRPR